MEGAPGRWLLLKDIVARVSVPGPYLAKILHALAQAGVVRAKRGYRGGFMLARPPEQVTIAEIVDAIEGDSWLAGCMLGFTQCTEDRACPAHAFCKTERTNVRALLEKLTLKDVAEFELRHGTIPRAAIGAGEIETGGTDGPGAKAARGRKPAGKRTGGVRQAG